MTITAVPAIRLGYGSSLVDREPLFVAKIAELQASPEDKISVGMAKVMTSFQVGLFAGTELKDYPNDNLDDPVWVPG